MAAVKKSVWNLGYRIAGVIVFLFSFLHLSPPSWARSIATTSARSKSSQALKPEAGALMESFLRESQFSNAEIGSLNSSQHVLLAGAQTQTSTAKSKQPAKLNQPKQAMTKQEITKQNQPPQAMKLKQTGQPQQAMKLNQPNQAMKLKQTGQPNQAMKLAQPNQAMKLKQADQPKQPMKLAQPNKTNQPQQAMKLKQGEPGAKQ
jgi:FtsZ-interacting cell division protein ZipA